MASHEIPNKGGEGDVAPLVPDAETQAVLMAKGWWLARWVYDGKDRLVQDGIIQDAQTVEDALRGDRKFIPGRSPIDGGWRRISGERGMRLTLLHSTDPQRGLVGYVEFEMADLTIVGGASIGSEAAEVTDHVKVDIHEDGAYHVSGAIGDVPFSVDNPDPATSFADLDAAKILLDEAKAGLDFLVPGLTPQTIARPQGS